jgi:hypothetical protein
MDRAWAALAISALGFRTEIADMVQILQQNENFPVEAFSLGHPRVSKLSILCRWIPFVPDPSSNTLDNLIKLILKTCEVLK